jgi:hypothetical protein
MDLGLSSGWHPRSGSIVRPRVGLSPIRPNFIVPDDGHKPKVAWQRPGAGPEVP